METENDSNIKLNRLVQNRSSVKILGWTTALLPLTVIGIPIALGTGILYRTKKNKLKKTEHGDRIGEYIQRRREFVAGVISSEIRIAEWEAQENELRYNLECLEKKWGLPIYFKEDAVLCELHLESESAPKGPIEGATALYSDNTATQIVATGAVSTTSYVQGSNYSGDIDYNRLKSSATNTQYTLTPVSSGTASVQLSGPKLIPGVLLFDTASEAQSFTNAFNSAARMTKDAVKNLKSNIVSTKQALKEHSIVGEGDFGAKDLLASIDDLPDDVQNWILGTADSQRGAVQMGQALRSMGVTGNGLAGNLTKAIIKTAFDQAQKR